MGFHVLTGSVTALAALIARCRRKFFFPFSLVILFNVDSKAFRGKEVIFYLSAFWPLYGASRMPHVEYLCSISLPIPPLLCSRLQLWCLAAMHDIAIFLEGSEDLHFLMWNWLMQKEGKRNYLLWSRKAHEGALMRYVVSLLTAVKRRSWYSILLLEFPNSLGYEAAWDDPGAHTEMP